MITPLLLQDPRPTRVVGRPKGSFMGVFSYLKWRWALNHEITDSAAKQGWCPRLAACNSWCIHHPALCDGRMCTAGTGAGRANGLIWLNIRQNRGREAWWLYLAGAFTPPPPPPPPPCCWRYFIKIFKIFCDSLHIWLLIQSRFAALLTSLIARQ